MTKLADILERCFRTTVLVLFGIFTGYLALLSLFSTNYCFVGKPSIFVSDSPWKALICYAGVTGVILLVRRGHFGRWLAGHEKGMRKAGSLLLFLFLLFFIVSVQVHPQGDQLAISNGAVGMRKYDFSLFKNNSYFVYWPFQARILVFLWGFFTVFGNLNYIAFHIMNAFCIVISLNLVAEISGMAGGENEAGRKTAVLFACMLFWPYLFYVTFVYGNIVGFTCITASVFMLMRYLQRHRKRDLAGVAVFCVAGVWLKNTFLIFMVAIFIFLLLDFCQRRYYASLAGILCNAVLESLTGYASDALVEKRLGFSLTDGPPMIGWVTMAFGEDENGRPVKFDGYNRDVYLDNDLDTEKAQEAAVAELKRRLVNLTDTPEHFVRFMGQKIAIEWNEPTFESLVVNNRQETQTEQSELIRGMLQENNRNVLLKFANLFHALVLLGALSWVLCKGREEETARLFFAVVFIGGFLFQLAWETYAQYTLFYFLLLIPYAVSGYLAMADNVEGCLRQRRADQRLLAGFGTAGVVLLLVGLVPFWGFSKLFRLDLDTVSYTEELAAMDGEKALTETGLENGYYMLSPLLMEGYGIVPLEETDGNGMPAAGIGKLSGGDEGVVSIYHEFGYDFLRLKSTQYLLSLSGDPSQTNVIVGQDYDRIMWKIIPAKRLAESGGQGIGLPDNGYAITCDGGYALTARDGRLAMEPFTGDKAQIWCISAVS